jgi:hypothetical protein
MALSKEGLLAACSIKVEGIVLPDSFGEGFAGETVHLRTLTIGEQDAYDASLVGADGKSASLKDYTSRYLCLTLANEDGSQMFSNKEIKKVAGLGADLGVFLMKKAQELNDTSATEEAEAAKN